MRNIFLLLCAALPATVFSCVNGDTSPAEGGAPDGTTTDAGQEADASLPTGATIALGVNMAWVPQNGQAQVPFTIARNGVTGTLTVHAASLPNGITATDATVPDGQSSGSLTLAASGSSTLGATATANIQLLDQTQNEDQKTIVVGASGKPGDLDTTWGTGGTLNMSLKANTVGYAIDVYPPTAGANAGKIVVAGSLNNSSTDVRIVIARYTVAGALDTTFGDLAGDGGTTRLGYTIFNPGANDTSFATFPRAVRIDSKGRIAVTNRRNGSCLVELGRWTVDGDIDSTFTRYSGNLNGAYCGEEVDLRVIANDDLAMLTQWNIPIGVETIVQVFSGADGSRQGSGFHLSLDSSGTAQNQKTTAAFAMQVDKNGGYVLAGRQCDGGWAGYVSCRPIIARLTPNGQRDSTFGSSAGYTSFQFGTGLDQLFFGMAIDPSNGDVIAVGTNDTEKLGALGRVNGSSGLPANFGSQGELTRDLLSGATSEELLAAMVDSRGRIVAVGNASTASQSYVARMRSAADGTLDSNYASGGVGVTIGAAENAALGNDDRLYVIGYTGSNLAIFRYWP